MQQQINMAEQQQKRDVSPKRKRTKKVSIEGADAIAAKALDKATTVAATEEVKAKKKQVKKKAEPKGDAKPKAAGSKSSDLEMAIKLLQGGFHDAALELLLALQKNATKKRAAPKKKKEVAEKE